MAASGGTELNAVRTAEALDRARVELTVFAMRPEGPMRARYAAAGVPVVAAPPVSTLVSPHTARQAWRLARQFRDYQVDVVHCHDVYTNWFAGIAARPCRPAAADQQAVDRRPPAAPAAQPRRIPAVHARAREQRRRRAHAGGLRRRAERPCVVVPNFVEDEAFALADASALGATRAAWGVPAGEPVLGCVARLRGEKGQATLLRAAARLRARWPALVVILVGDGPQEAALRTLAEGLGLAGRVCFAGHQPNRPNLHRLFDVSVLASDHEGFPNTLVEAMAAGRPTVASDVGGVPDAVRHEETGLLVPPGDDAALAGALARVLADPAWAARLGERGRVLAWEQFRAAAVTERLMAVYATLAGRGALVSGRTAP
jgi:glycosyltransferase involved in cell wall biosynthesis